MCMEGRRGVGSISEAEHVETVWKQKLQSCIFKVESATRVEGGTNGT